MWVQIDPVTPFRIAIFLDARGKESVRTDAGFVRHCPCRRQAASWCSGGGLQSPGHGDSDTVCHEHIQRKSRVLGRQNTEGWTAAGQ